jgi:formyl-CoA transferase
MPGPLHGIHVVELTTMITGPLTGMMLADLGASVVKIENPEGGDPFRSYGGSGYSAQFCSYNRNKRSLAISLRDDLGKKALEALVRRSDILLENFRPGVLDRLGFSDARLTGLNPSLIRCSITGFGAGGPYAARPCYDAIAQALSGMSSQFLDHDNPRLTGTTISDNVTGQYACAGILAALLERERTGIARRVEVNMLEATMAFMPEPFGYLTQDGQTSDAYLRIKNSQAYAFRCKDGKLVAIHLSSQEKFWRQFAETIGRNDLPEDSRFLTLAARVTNYESLLVEAAVEFGKFPRADWLKRFEKVDVPFIEINDIADVFSNEQVKHLDPFFELIHPQKGKLVGIRRPILFDGSRDDQDTAAPPTLGQHTQEILAELDLNQEWPSSR